MTATLCRWLVPPWDTLAASLLSCYTSQMKKANDISTVPGVPCRNALYLKFGLKIKEPGDMIFRDLSYKVLEQSKIVHAIAENHNRRSLLIT